jgi:hypothetical protein
MSNNQADKMYLALKLGYRTKANGERVVLSEGVAKQYIGALKSAWAKYGRLVYDSANGPYVSAIQANQPSDNYLTA